MKKKLLLFLILLFPLTVFADEPKVLTLEANLNDNTVSYSGTIENGSHAVMCKLLNDDGEELDKLSLPVDNGAFSGLFVTSTTGDYKIACANYGGGEIKTVSVSVETVATYTVTFNTNGGSVISPVVVEYGQAVQEPSLPTKDDLMFEGWYEDSTLTTPFDFSKLITANITLYAKWTVAMNQLQLIFTDGGGTYQVDFDTDVSDIQGALGAPVTSSNRYFVTKGNEVTLTAVADDTHEFVGWYNCQEVDISNGHGVMGWNPVGDALSTSNSYTFAVIESYYNIMPIFDSKAGHNNIWATSGGKVAVLYENGENPELDGEHFGIGHVVDYWKGDSITVKAVAEDGYHFVGWYVSDVEKGPEYYLRTPVVSTNASFTYQPKITTVTGVDEPINYLTAAFEENALGMFVVSFNTNGGSNIEPIEVEAGHTVLKPQDPTNGNKIFIQWCEDDTLTTEFDFETPINANITLYAKWQTPTFTVTFNTNGGSEIDSVEVLDGEMVVKPNEPTKNGLVFAGWYEEAELEHEFSFDSPITSDKTIYAKWDKEYDIEDENGNEVIFADEPDQTLTLVVTDLSHLTDEELAGMQPPMDRETYEAVIESLTEASKKYGTLLTFLDISVLDTNDEPVEVGEVTVRLKITDALKGYKSYKLVYLETDNNDNIILSDDYTLTVDGDYLVGTLPHLSAYVLAGSNTEEETHTNTTTGGSPKTGDHIIVWIVMLVLSGVGIFISLKAKRVK